MQLPYQPVILIEPTVLPMLIMPTSIVLLMLAHSCLVMLIMSLQLATIQWDMVEF